MTLFEFILLAPVSLFLIINPLSTAPAFLAMTEGDDRASRLRMLRIGCMVAGSIILFFAISGQFLFSVLGITIPALQIAGGVLLFVIGFDMLRLPDSPARFSEEEQKIATRMDDVAITPLAIPLLCGPGSISTVIILQTQAIDWRFNIALLLSVPLVYLACYLVLRVSIDSARWLNPIVLRVLRRIMGLLFATIAVQFIINGVGNLPFVAETIN